MAQQVGASSLTCLLVLFLLASASSVTAVGTARGNHASESGHRRWQRKTWMNHGSSRGPKKQLVNPTLENPFQAREFPV
ncbi:hypothetical protein QN277_014437 [Acacia crassicarpa]|uniref:Uncharacterized protein n=1 Tax=Acacia crassicarpa TaxID=499986 RepID=A0AAE1IM33_9FABA|nr:hypothetical protein QN277_014437 [Acacia crassicarpa]